MHDLSQKRFFPDRQINHFSDQDSIAISLVVRVIQLVQLKAH
jgi:hypothetical protein